MGLFNKALFFTDIHFGKKSDSELHNQDCLRFVEWVCDIAKDRKVDTVFILGDVFENRQKKIGLLTLHYASKAFAMLNELGVPVYVLVGNHDLFFKYSREVHALSLIGQYSNIHIINEITEMDDVLLCPWLIGGEYAMVPEHETKYVLGHFELPTFLFNEMMEMPDRGGLHADHFYQNEYVFTGHFHKRQIKRNKNGIPVCYIGNTFPMDFNDEGDTERGCMYLEWGQEPEFIDWPDAPSYFRVTLSGLLMESSNMFNENSVLDCIIDIELSKEEEMEVRETLSEQCRSIMFRNPVKFDQAEEETDVDLEGGDINSMVIEHLEKLDERDGIERELLVSLFKGEK
jgi:DNA repair exonuclease SbcCD nuclease subunit